MGIFTKKNCLYNNILLVSIINDILHMFYMYVDIICIYGDQYINFKKNPLTILKKLQWIVTCNHKLNIYHTIPSAPNGAINFNRPQQIINILGGFR